MFAVPAALNHVASLYQQHHRWLLGWLRQRLDCPAQAADLSQDTFVRLLQQPQRPTIDEPRALLGTIARGLLIDHYRRRSLERAYLQALAMLLEPLHPGPEEQLQHLQTLVALDRVLDGLKPCVRETFLLSQVEGLAYAEIAQRLGRSISSIQQYMGQALRHCHRQGLL